MGGAENRQPPGDVEVSSQGSQGAFAQEVASLTHFQSRV